MQPNSDNDTAATVDPTPTQPVKLVTNNNDVGPETVDGDHVPYIKLDGSRSFAHILFDGTHPKMFDNADGHELGVWWNAGTETWDERPDYAQVLEEITARKTHLRQAREAAGPALLARAAAQRARDAYRRAQRTEKKR
jgi:hypothetical protein